MIGWSRKYERLKPMQGLPVHHYQVPSYNEPNISGINKAKIRSRSCSINLSEPNLNGWNVSSIVTCILILTQEVLI